jgi:hypothetical protein
MNTHIIFITFNSVNYGSAFGHTTKMLIYLTAIEEWQKIKLDKLNSGLHGGVVQWEGLPDFLTKGGKVQKKPQNISNGY